MQLIMMIMTAVVLSGCSASYTTYRAQPVVVREDIGQLSRKAHFVELMEFVRENHHLAPTPEMKKTVERLMFEAALVQQCANKKCWLAYGELRITTDDMFINIESKDKSVIKIDINEPDRAAKVIYG